MIGSGCGGWLGRLTVLSSLCVVAGWFAATVCCAQAFHEVPSRDTGGGDHSGNLMADRILVEKGGVILKQGDGWLKVQAISEGIIRVSFARDPEFFSQESLIVLPQGAFEADVRSDSERVTVSTPRLRARVELKSGLITFFDLHGNVLLREKARDLAEWAGSGREDVSCSAAMGRHGG